MFTVTRNEILPTTVTGSWPRPRWYTAQLDGAALSARMRDVTYREQFTDALAVVADDQERAGLDVLTTGDYFHDEDVGGQAWLRYPLERWAGLEGDFVCESADMPRFPTGTLLAEVFGAMRWPRVVGTIASDAEKSLEYAKIWRIAQARTRKPVRFGAISVQALSQFLGEPGESGWSDSRRQRLWELATVNNAELRELAASGCKCIQLEEPSLHLAACYRPDDSDLLDFLVAAFNHEVAGLEDVEIWVHTCWGNPHMQRGVEDVSYRNAIALFMERLNVDVWTIEGRGDDGRELDMFAPYTTAMDKKIALGVVSHRSLQVERPGDVAELVRRALKFIPAERLILSSDCGFGRQGGNRVIALYKAAAIALGANIVRRELGLDERYVPLADEALRVDVV
jgi:5-methyltetrahydropteroyltriglutamate--homocysteine methyltransferase